MGQTKKMHLLNIWQDILIADGAIKFRGEPVNFETTSGTFIGGTDTITVNTDDNGIAIATLEGGTYNNPKISATVKCDNLSLRSQTKVNNPRDTESGKIITPNDPNSSDQPLAKQRTITSIPGWLFGSLGYYSIFCQKLDSKNTSDTSDDTPIQGWTIHLKDASGEIIDTKTTGRIWNRETTQLKRRCSLAG